MKQIVVADIHRDGGDKLSARSTTTVQQTLIRKEQTLAQERRGKLSSSNTYAVGFWCIPQNRVANSPTNRFAGTEDAEALHAHHLVH